MKKYYTILALLFTSMYCQAQSPEENLKKLGITLQIPNAPIANYVDYVRTGNLIYLSGSGPDNAFKGVSRGQLGKDLTIEEGAEAARHVGINLIANLKSAIGDLNKVIQDVQRLGLDDLATRVVQDLQSHCIPSFAGVGMGWAGLRTADTISKIPGHLLVFSDA